MTKNIIKVEELVEMLGYRDSYYVVITYQIDSPLSVSLTKDVIRDLRNIYPDMKRTSSACDPNGTAKITYLTYEYAYSD